MQTEVTIKIDLFAWLVINKPADCNWQAVKRYIENEGKEQFIQMLIEGKVTAALESMIELAPAITREEELEMLEVFKGEYQNRPLMKLPGGIYWKI